MDANQQPTFSANVPADLDGDGESAIMLASEYFGEPLEWQSWTACVLLARNDRDKYRVPTFCMAVPRQNGKSWTVRARCFYGLVCCGEKILYTCHLGDTSDEMFRALSAPFEDEDNIELHALLKAVRKANGQQAIYLNNGGFIRFTTRTDNLARGRSYDVLIYDEAQELTTSQQAASLPSIAASAKKNTQVIYIGTPPEAPIGVFAKMRDKVRDGRSKAAWLEWSVPDVADPNDRSLWYLTNPSLGTLITETAIEAEADSMDADVFSRERLGWWSEVAGNAAIDIEQWRKCEVGDAPSSGGVVSFAVKFTTDGDTAVLAACRKVDGLSPYVEIVGVLNTKRGTSKLADWLLERKGVPAQVSIDGKSRADALVKRITGKGRYSKAAVKQIGMPEIVSACAMFGDAIDAGQLAHCGQEVLDSAAASCPKRRIGTAGGYGYDSTDKCMGEVLEAAALAYWGAMTTKRDPNRKLRAG